MGKAIDFRTIKNAKVKKERLMVNHFHFELLINNTVIKQLQT